MAVAVADSGTWSSELLLLGLLVGQTVRQRRRRDRRSDWWVLEQKDEVSGFDFVMRP